MDIIDDVEVFDNTFTFDDCVKMVKLVNLYQEEGFDKLHGNFERIKDDRRPSNQKFNNPIEFLINDFLDKVGDDSRHVEYWYRPRWRNMTCHQDLNEYIVKEYGRIVNPKKGHIVYLSESANHASTIIFNREMTALTVVSPKIGRIVRFNGLSHHSVPKPFDRIFEKQKEYGIEENFGVFRHALLFNTWDDYIPSPHELPVKGNIQNPLTFKQMSEWKKLPLFDVVRVKKDSINIEMMYMGDAARRFGFNKVGKFKINKRIKTDGYHQRLISYEVIMDIESHKPKDNECNNL